MSNILKYLPDYTATNGNCKSNFNTKKVVVCYYDDITGVDSLYLTAFRTISDKAYDMCFPIGSIIDIVDTLITQIASKTLNSTDYAICSKSMKLHYGYWALCDGHTFDGVLCKELRGMLGSNRTPNLVDIQTVMYDWKYPNVWSTTPSVKEIPEMSNMRQTVGAFGFQLTIDNVPPHRHTYTYTVERRKSNSDGSDGSYAPKEHSYEYTRPTDIDPSIYDIPKFDKPSDVTPDTNDLRTVMALTSAEYLGNPIDPKQPFMRTFKIIKTR